MRVKLKDVCRVVSGATPKSGVDEYWDGDIKWVTPAELGDDAHYVHDTARHITEAGFASASLRMMPVGTVLLSTRAPIGKVAITKAEMCCNQGFKNLICTDAIDSEYLFHCLRSRNAELQALGRGATFKELSKKDVENFEVPLPDIETQRAIAANLQYIDDVISIEKQCVEKLDDLVKSRFIEMFGDPIQNNKSWPTRPIAAIASLSGCRVPETGSVWLLNLDAVEANSGRVLIKTYEEAAAIKGSNVGFTEKHVLYSKLRPYLNKVVLPVERGVCTAELVPLLPDASMLDRVYLCFMLRSDHFVRFISERTVGAKMPRVDMAQFRAFAIPVPPLELQQEFASFVAQVDKTKAAVQQSIDKLQILYDSLAQEYFGGGLG